MRYQQRLLFIAIFDFFCACTGDRSGVGTTFPQVTANANDAAYTQSIQLRATPTSATLRAIAQISATLVFPAVSTPATIDVSVSATAPAGAAPSSVRHPRSGTLTVYEYITLAVPLTTTLPSLPAMTFTFPATTPIAGKTFSYGLSDLNAQGGIVSFDTQGPGAVNGQSVSFAQVPTPITLDAGHTYTFVVYATTTAFAASRLYLTSIDDRDPNNPAGELTTYDASGTQVAPTITAGLLFPQSVTVSAAGKIYVAAIGIGSGTVTTYALDGTPSTPTISSGLAGPLGVAVDAVGKVYVTNIGTNTGHSQESYVSIFDAHGTPTPTVITAALDFPDGLAIDAAGKIYVANQFNNTITTYRGDGTQASPTIAAGLNGPTGIAVDSAGKIYVANFAGNTVTTYNPDGSATTPTISAGLNGPNGVAVDATGKIYVSNSGGQNVTTYNPNGTQSSPTIAAPVNYVPSGIAVH